MRTDSLRWFRGRKRNQGSRRSWNRNRRTGFEALESRTLLSITFSSPGSQSVASGAGLNVVLSGSESSGDALTYTVSLTDSNLTHGDGSTTALTAAVTAGNPTLQLTVSYTGDPNVTTDDFSGTLTFQLFEDLTPETVEKIVGLVENDFYNSSAFHRIIGYVAQGGSYNGDGTGGSGTTIDDEYNVMLQYTSGGLLAMANHGDDTNDCQFFITNTAVRGYDFSYTIFGILTDGYDLLDKIAAVDVEDNGSGETSSPVYEVSITDASIVTNSQAGVLRLYAENGVTGTVYANVICTDARTGESVSQTFKVTVAADTVNDPPFLDAIDPITTTMNTAVSFTISATDVEGDAMQYKAEAKTGTDNVTVTCDPSSGLVTVTPANGIFGFVIVKLSVSADDDGQTWDTQYVPVYIAPWKPTIALSSDSDTGSSTSDGITRLNNSLQFTVSGVVSEAMVRLYCDGTLIGSAAAEELAEGTTTVTIATNASMTLTDGVHTFTATQTLEDLAVKCNNLQTTVDLPSDSSDAATVMIKAADPTFDFTPVEVGVVGVKYTCQIAVDAASASGATYDLLSSLAGMSIEGSTGLITWNPGSSYADATVSVVVEVTDVAGNKAQTQYSVTVKATNAAPVLDPASPSLGATDEDTTVTIDLSDCVTGITDEDADAVTGGIALVGLTGNGAWAYSLDGAAFVAIGSVSESSALLLPYDAMLAYTPDGKNAESATITYRAWDTSGGAEAIRVDLSVADATGGSTAYSTDTDTATLTVTAVNDAPVLTAATPSPSLGSTTADTAATVSLASFINTGGGTTVTDVDSGAAVGGIAVTAVSGSGTWAYSLDGTTYTDISAVSISSALLLAADAHLRYTPDGSTVETATISYLAWDTTSGTSGGTADASTIGGATAFSSVDDTASLTVTALNTAPVLTVAYPSLGTTGAATAKTLSLADFINTTDGTTVTDADTGAVLGGIALVGVTGNGTWAYSLDGTTYTDIDADTLSESSALLLAADASLRYTPDGASTETATITYRAWDASSGTSGQTADTTTHGGASAFSSSTDTASLTVGDCSISGFVYLDTNNDGLRTTSWGTHLALQGVIVTLYVQSNDTWTQVTSTTTDSSGAYCFDGLAAGVYKIAETQPAGYIDGKETVGSLDGASSGAAGADQFVVTLAAGNVGGEYNFGERGVSLAHISLRSLMASASLSSASSIVTQTNAAPVVKLSSASTNVALSYAADGTTLTLASAATITDADSTTLAYLKATLASLIDTGYETLAVNVSGTSLTASYANGVLTVSGKAGVATYEAVLRTLTYTDTADSPTEGMRKIKIVANDGVVDCAAAIALVNVASTACSIKLADTLIGAAEAATTAFTFSNAEVGATYAYTVVSDADDSESVTGAGTITSAAQKVTGIDVSGLDDGTLTYTVTVTSADGETVVTLTAAATLDQIAPTGYQISADRTYYTSSTASSLSFTFTGAEIGATYYYTVTSDEGTGTVSASGTIASATQQVTGVNVSALSDGVLTIGVYLVDPAGNVGDLVAAVPVLDRTAPSGYSITISDADTDDHTVAFKFAGAELLSTYDYTITDAAGNSVTGSDYVTSQTLEVTGINVASLADDGDLTFRVYLTDLAGNRGDTVTAAIDRTAPVGYTITVNDSKISTAESKTVGFTFADAEVGATWTCTVTSSGDDNATTLTFNGSSAIALATESVTGLDVSPLPDGTLTFTVTLTDAAGNVGEATTATATLDKTAPGEFTITPGATIVDADLADAFGFVISGAETFTTYTYTITSSGDAGAASVTGSGTITLDAYLVSGIDISSLSDGVLTITVTITDAAGNSTTVSDSTATLEQGASSGYSVAFDEALYNQTDAKTASFTITKAEIGTTCTYTITDKDGKYVTNSANPVPIASVGQQVSGIDVSSLADGTLTLSVTLTDSHTNVGNAATATATLDKTAPTGYTVYVSDTTIDSTEATKFSFTIEDITAEDGLTYSYEITSSNGGTAVTYSDLVVSTSGTQEISGIDVSGLSDGDLTIKVTLFDAMGNAGWPSYGSATLDQEVEALDLALAGDDDWLSG
jgi:large repetitive protein